MSKSIPVSFKNKEVDLLEFIKDKDFSYYVKSLIKKDMSNTEIPIIQKKEEETHKPRRNANFDI